MTKKKVAKKVAKKVPVKTVKTPEIDKVACEREFRKYVRRDGGFCKGISRTDRERAKKLAKLLGKKEFVWDQAIIPVPQKSRIV